MDDLAPAGNSVADRAAAAITHMNADHVDALVDLWLWSGGSPDVEAVCMTALDAHGCDLEASTETGRTTVRVPFDPPLTDGAQIRSVMIELTRRARLAR